MKYVRRCIVTTSVAALIALISLHFVFGNQNNSINALAGIYQTAASSRISQIRLNQDGTYTHEFSEGEFAHANTGMWTIETAQEDNHVVLSSFVSFPGEEALLGGLGTNGGYYLLRINHDILGEISLVYNVDLGLSYRKLHIFPITPQSQSPTGIVLPMSR